MPFMIMLAIILVGGGAVSAAVVGLQLPGDQRLAAALALVLGAGVGAAALAIGLFIADPSTSGPEPAPTSAQAVVLIASAAGFLAVVSALVVVWRRSRR
jgi:hypothetical protein